MRCAALLLVLVSAPVFADPPGMTPAQPATTPDPAPVVGQPLPLFDVPAKPALSLRLEAVRVATDRFRNDDWRYPDPGAVLGFTEGQWFLGYGQYHPRTRRSAALHVGSMASTMAGQILLDASPLLGAAALITGATLDAAAADVDRDAEARGGR